MTVKGSLNLAHIQRWLPLWWMLEGCVVITGCTHTHAHTRAHTHSHQQAV